MTSAAHVIRGIAEDARAQRLDSADALSRLADAAQARGGREGRRSDGAFFTDHDVAARIARRAIAPLLLQAAGVEDDEVDELLAGGGDLHLALSSACRSPAARAAAVDRLQSLRVLDPTCGAGSFLTAAWRELSALELLLDARVVTLDQLHGIDLDQDAVAACVATLEIESGGCAPPSNILVGDAEHQSSLPHADVVIGNPPFVRARAAAAPADLATRMVPNRSAWIVERALAAASPGARIGFVLPISTACTDAFAPARAAWDIACDRIFTSHFDTIPSSLFPGVVQRLSIFEGRRRDAGCSLPAQWWTSRYHRWTGKERATLLERVRHVRLPAQSVAGSLAKVGSATEVEILERIFEQPPAGRFFVHADPLATVNRFHYKRRWSYFLLFTDFVPGIWNGDGSERAPSEFKSVDVDRRLDARVLLAAYSSSLFWWYFSVFTDNRNVNRRDLAAFPFPDLAPEHAGRLADLGDELMCALRACAEVRTCTYRSIGTIRNTYFRQGATRPVLDRIDRELAAAYGLDDAQLDFVLGFERRFRS